MREVLIERGWSPEGAEFLLSKRDNPVMAKFLAKLQGTPIKTRLPPSQPKLPIPIELRWQIWERDNFTCQRCGARRYLTIDHIYPERLGGTLAAENLQTLCASCNSQKGSKA
jgi:hypothetical protein